MRAFIAIRHLVLPLRSNPIQELQQEVKQLKDYIEDVFADYNDINDDTRMQLELINQTLAELQTQSRPNIKPRNPVGYLASQQKK